MSDVWLVLFGFLSACGLVLLSVLGTVVVGALAPRPAPVEGCCRGDVPSNRGQEG